MLTGVESTGFAWSLQRRPDGEQIPEAILVCLQWYETKASRNRRWYRTSEVLIVVLSAAVPVAAALGLSNGVAAVLGALVVATVGLRQLYRWRDTWIRYSQTLASLQTEVVKWNIGASPYSDPRSADAILMTTVEEIARAEMSTWATSLQRSDSGGGGSP